MPNGPVLSTEAREGNKEGTEIFPPAASPDPNVQASKRPSVQSQHLQGFLNSGEAFDTNSTNLHESRQNVLTGSAGFRSSVQTYGRTHRMSGPRFLEGSIFFGANTGE